MNSKIRPRLITAVLAASITLSLAIPRFVSAHCDTLDGPVIKDARVALEQRDVTPVLKWVRKKDEVEIQKAFKQAVAAATSGATMKEEGEHRFFETLVKIHRESEGAPFTGLKPAGEVEPAVAEADKALESGSVEHLVQLIADDVAAGIKRRFMRAAEAYAHKDESVTEGREFVKAYVEFTHYVERLHLDATGKSSHGERHEAGHHD